jgi:hypothetical protein
MAFTSLKLKPASGANRIKSADDAYSFMMHMQLSYQNKPHWQAAKQVDQHDLRDLIDMGLVEMRNDAPVLTNAGVDAIV